MHRLVDYHRPTSLAEAVELLAGDRRLALAGGTTLRHDRNSPPAEVVDLQALGLDAISAEAGQVRLGATARLQAVADHEAVPAIVRDAARAEQPSTLRTLSTVGGTIGAADSESLLLAALLAHDAVVDFADETAVLLPEVLASRPGNLMVAITIEAEGRGAVARAGRTPADSPIVGAVGRTIPDGVRLALCGVADVPVIVDRADIDALDPPGDFRGSATYRKHLASVLSARVIGELT